MSAPKTERNRQILARYSDGETQAAIAADLGLAQSRVSRVIRAKEASGVRYAAAQRARVKQRRAEDPVYAQRLTDSHRANVYGLSREAFAAMREKQDDACAICLAPEGRTRNGKNRLLCVDHDHKTGRVRALLCAGCNTMIGHARENPELLRAGALYLETHGL